MKNTKRHSDWWLSENTKRKLDRGIDLSPIELAQAKRSIAEFVEIMTRRNIPVKFKTEEGEEESRSYTDGEVVTIGCDLDEDGFDETVGIALHEASHICESDMELLREFKEASENNTAPDLVPQEFIDKIEPLLKKSDDYKKIEEMIRKASSDYDESELDPEIQAARALHHIWNVVEDRWIDQWAYSEAPGYRKYYEKMYQEYWHSDRISNALEYDERRLEIQEELGSGADPQKIINREIDSCPEQFEETFEEAKQKLSNSLLGSADADEVREFLIENVGIQKTWSEYIYRITNITNDSLDLQVLPGLEKIWDILDVTNIERHDSSWETLETAKKIMRVVLENAESLYIDPAFGAGGGDGDCSYDDLPDELQEQLQDQLEQMSGEAGEELEEETAEKVETLEEAGVEQEQVGEEVSNSTPDKNSAEAAGTPCVVIESISEGMTEESHFPIIKTHKQRYSEEGVSRGFKKGRILGNKLKIRDERRKTKHTRKRTGSLDSRMLAEIGNSNRLFYREHIEEYRDGFIHISVDASGSMRGEKFQDAMENCVAIAKAADMIRNIRAQVSFRSTVSVGRNKQPLIVLAYDSKREPIQNVQRFFPYISASGTTPEGLTFEAIQKKILPSNKERESYFVNLSDGKPNFSQSSGENSICYGGEPGLEHTRQEVEKMRRKDVQVISYFIGSGRSDRNFQKMYGDDSRFIDPTNITKIQRTLNEKFLDKDAKKH